MDLQHSSRVMFETHRQRRRRNNGKSNFAYLLVLLIALVASKTCRNPSSRPSALLFVSSFTAKNLNQPITESLGYRSHGATLSVFASAGSSTTTKPPALTDWVVVEEYPTISPDGIDPYKIIESITSSNDFDDDSKRGATEKYENALGRLNVTRQNLTLPIAIMSLDSERYPSLSNARKAVRQGKIAFRLSEAKGSLPPFRKGLVGDRVYPLDSIVRRELYKNLLPKNSSSASYETLGAGFVKSKFQNLHVAYEDDCMAVVVKPAGLLVHPQGKNGGWGRKNNLLNALPYFLNKPPIKASYDDDDQIVLDQPVPVHRLDFATSGLLVAAKTKGASRLLAQEFEYRKAQKTYTAMVYGIPVADNEDTHGTIPSFFGQSDDDKGDSTDNEGMAVTGSFVQKTSNEEDGSDLDDDELPEDDEDWKDWNLADCFLDKKRARTRWRVLGSHNCSVPIRYTDVCDDDEDAKNFINIPISIIEMKPKTGRYHQLRRTMAWLYKTPMVGDPVYSSKFVEENFLPNNAELMETKQAKDYRASLMLCSNEVDVAHPYYNTAAGRLAWEKVSGEEGSKTTCSDISSSSVYEAEDGVVRVTAAIQLPKKFTKFIGMMERKSKE